LNSLTDQYKSFIVDCSTTGGGKSGGIISLWNPSFDVDIKMFDSYYIDAIISSSLDNTSWRCARIYGFPQHHNKFLTCDTISNLANNNWNPNWLIFGDFNMILSNEEKMGGNSMDLNISQLFRDTITVCHLMDLGYQGDIFTWANNHDDNHIKCILDIYFATQEWTTLFPNFSNSHLIKFGSDHNPLLLEFSSTIPNRSKFPKPKRFEKIWLNNEDHINIVQQAWNNSQDTIAQRLTNTLNCLTQWGAATFGDITKKIRLTQNSL